MSNYAVFFDKNDKTMRLPVNPEEIEVSSTQANEKYEILKLGQIAVPSHMELKEYSFEIELPHECLHYVETPNLFKNAEEYLTILTEWRDELEPIRFLAGMATGEYTLASNIINTPVLIESLSVKEKAGEEQDKYVSIKLLEYREFGKQEVLLEVDKKTGKTKKAKADKSNPKSNGSYVVQRGDTLWAIAKKYYGDGSKYTKIFNANKDKIKNPSLIYAGQKLVMPA
jgi:nucleoid-associated protein YgaU